MTKTIVHVSDAKASSDPSNVIATYSLGSCIAVALYDPATNIGGMLHFQLPNSKIDPERAKEKPFMFGDSGMNILVKKLTSMGANKKRMNVKIAGGAAMETGPLSYSALIFSLSILFPIGFGIAVMGEKPSIFHMIGLLLLLFTEPTF